MLDLIGIAWGVEAGKVVGGPGWLGFDRFDVSAKAPPSSTPEAVNGMLQSLLAERFQLVLHRDSKPLPAFALIRGKGQLKLKEASGTGSIQGNSGCQGQQQPGAASYSMFACRHVP